MFWTVVMYGFWDFVDSYPYVDKVDKVDIVDIVDKVDSYPRRRSFRYNIHNKIRTSELTKL